MRFLLTTVTGLEDVAAGEAAEWGALPVRALQGRLVVEGPSRLLPLLNLAAKCVERVYVLLAEGSVETLDDVYRATREAGCAFLDRNQSFAVRAARRGDHPFRSVDVAGTVGQAVIDAHAEAGKPRPPVSLNYPRVEFKAWVVDDAFTLGVNATGEGLHKRRYRVYQHPAPLNPCLASALLRLAGYAGGDLLDPFCGSGTILIEAAHGARRVHNGLLRTDFAFPELPWTVREEHREVRADLTDRMERVPLRLQGVDVSPKHLDGARLNAKAAFVDDALDLVLGDAVDLPADVPPLVVTNPPYGLRVGSVKRLAPLYEGFAASLSEHPGTDVVVLSAYPEAAQAFGDWKLLEERTVWYGNLRTPLRRYRVE